MKIFMTEPTYFFDKTTPINPFEESTLTLMDLPNKNLYPKQWNNLAEFISKNFDLEILKAPFRCPDGVFVCDAGDFLTDTHILISTFKYSDRIPESLYFRNSMSNYRFIETNDFFEGQGDTVHDFNGRVFIGNGFRTSKETIEEIKDYYNKEVIPVGLKSPVFYHLNMSFLPIDKKTAMYIPEAMENPEIIEQSFNHTIKLTLEEGKTFACNSLVYDDLIVAPLSSKEIFEKYLPNKSYVFFDMSEFQKSGGSIRCCMLVKDQSL
jgi:N-dimethylarginine dimethylaminohydrolase